MAGNQELVGQEWVEWRHHPQTKAFLGLLYLSVQEIQEEWSNKEYVSDNPARGAELNTAALGNIHALRKIIRSIEDIQ